MPALDHVFVIVMENHSYGEVVGSSSAPYFNGLLPSGALATSYTAVTHPSLPNYLALAAGSTFGIASDCTTCWISGTNVGDSLEAAGRTWKAYEESMPSPCLVGDAYPYAQKHDPFVYFNDVRANASRCQSHVVPYSQLRTDLVSAATTPSFGFITPNMCDDMHDCSIGTGDAWLQQNVPAIIASPAFTTQRALLMITWDEDDSTSSNRVAMLALGSGVHTGYHSTTAYNHYSALRTVEAALGIATVNAGDAGASPMSDLFGANALGTLTAMGGVLGSGPGAAACASGQIGVFVLGVENAVWWRQRTGGSWSSWTGIGGNVTSNPASSCRPQTSAFDLYTEGIDHALYHRVWNGTSWAGWENLGGSLTSGPGATSCATNATNVFVLGGDGVVWEKSWNGTTWSWWTRVGGNVTGNPSVACDAGGILHLLVEGTDHALYHRSFQGSTWSGWENLGGSLSSSPSAVSCSPGRVDVFVLGGDGVLWRKTFDAAGWGAWTPLAGNWASDPGSACDVTTGKIDVFERGRDLGLWEIQT